MGNRSKIIVACIATIVVFIIFSLLWMYITPSGRAFKDTYESKLHRVDDSLEYETLRRVEGTCRSMIASYTSDIHMAEAYKDSHRDWAEQAVVRANQTAAEYNEYILKNDFIWKGNVPNDIKAQLDYYELGE